MWTLLAACAGRDPQPSSPQVTVARTGALPYGAELLGARALSVVAAEPVVVTARLEADGTVRTIAFEERAAVQTLQLLGLRLETDHLLTVTLTDDRGGETVVGPWTVPGDPLPSVWPILEVLTRDPTREQPGWIALDAQRVADTVHFVALDPDLQPAYVWSSIHDLQDADLLGDGTLFARIDLSAWRIDLLGNVWQQWGNRALDPHHVAIATNELHHEVSWLGDGRFTSLSSRTLVVPAYPMDYADPDTLGGPASIRDPSLVTIDAATGEVSAEWFLSAALDTTRISYDSLTPSRFGDSYDGLDWAHANAAAPDLDGGFLVSCRHQDAIAKLGSDGALLWVLGDPAGWNPPWDTFLLDPVDENPIWPYHAHGVIVDPATGDVAMFDNHNNGETPYNPGTSAQGHSRVVAFRVDEAARTIRQVWAYDATATGPLFSPTQGSVQILPNGNVFADYAAVEEEAGLANAARGWGRRAVRLVEWSPDDPARPVLDVRLRSDASTSPEGWTAYRAHKAESLYPTTGPWRARETWGE